MLKTNFIVAEIPKENVHYACIGYVTIDSVLRIKKNELSTSLFRRMQTQNKENKDV